MRNSPTFVARPPSAPIVLCGLVLYLGAVRAQEPTPPAKAEEPAPARAPEKVTPEKVTAVHAGFVHTVSGGVIQDGVVLVRGTRITAVGPRAEVAVPPDATSLDFAGAHVYPGLVDAWTDAYVDNLTRGDGSLDAATRIADVLRVRGDREDLLVQNGITTAYVSSRSPAAWRGRGVVVRPTAGGFQILAGKEQAAIEARIANGPGPSHPMQRQQQAQALFAAFDGLADYRKLFTDHKQALEKYQKEFADYLAWFEKKNSKDAGAAPGAGPGRDGAREGAREGARPEAGGDTPSPGGRRGGRRGGNGGGGGNNGGGNAAGLHQEPRASAEDAQEPKPAEKQEPKPAESKPAEGGSAPAQDKPPERPKYPKEPAHDPVKDALLEVLAGAQPLRLEAHRPDEIRQALALAADKKVPVLVLEQPFAAASCAAELANAGVACVLADLWPTTLQKPYDAYDLTALPAALQQQGVAFAIATGSGRRAGALPLMAACAVGRGLDEAAALRAITLTPAEILGVQNDVGSLQEGKLGDLLVTDRPLFASDCRVLAVLSAGVTQFEAK
jgi:imidazolonepropionase-like amidohydrolase